MANRRAWWTIPAFFVVLARVVTLPADGVDRAPPAPAAAATPAPAGETGAPGVLSGPVAAIVPDGPVMLRNAVAGRRGPVWLVGEGTILRLPAVAAGVRADFAIQRYGAGGAREDWLAGTARVRPDGTMPFLGLQPGRYFVTLAFDRGGETVRLAGDFEAGTSLDLR